MVRRLIQEEAADTTIAEARKLRAGFSCITDMSTVKAT